MTVWLAAYATAHATDAVSDGRDERSYAVASRAVVGLRQNARYGEGDLVTTQALKATGWRVPKDIVPGSVWQMLRDIVAPKLGS